MHQLYINTIAGRLDCKPWQVENCVQLFEEGNTIPFITHMNDGSYKYERTTIKERQCYTNKWLKMPVPLSEVNNMRAITGEDWQNPGW